MKTTLLLALTLILLGSCKTVKKFKSHSNQHTDSVTVKKESDIHLQKTDSTYKLISKTDDWERLDSNHWGRVIKRWWFSFDTTKQMPVIDRMEEIQETGGSMATVKKRTDSTAVLQNDIRSDSTAHNKSDSTHVVASAGTSMDKTTRNALVSNFFLLVFAIFLVSFAFNKLKFSKITPLA